MQTSSEDTMQKSLTCALIYFLLVVLVSECASCLLRDAYTESRNGDPLEEG